MKQIDQFLKAEQFAMAGVSRKSGKFGNTVFVELRKKGMDLIPVNPNADEINGIKTYRSVGDLPENVEALLVVTPAGETASVVRAAREKGIKQIWIQQKSDTPESLKELEGTDINLVTGNCIMMFYKPSGFHKFHRNIRKFFGRLPA